jgi:hypothetical protein
MCRYELAQTHLILRTSVPQQALSLKRTPVDPVPSSRLGPTTMSGRRCGVVWWGMRAAAASDACVLHGGGGSAGRGEMEVLGCWASQGPHVHACTQRYTHSMPHVRQHTTPRRSRRRPSWSARPSPSPPQAGSPVWAHSHPPPTHHYIYIHVHAHTSQRTHGSQTQAFLLSRQPRTIRITRPHRLPFSICRTQLSPPKHTHTHATSPSDSPAATRTCLCGSAIVTSGREPSRGGRVGERKEGALAAAAYMRSSGRRRSGRTSGCCRYSE